MSGTVRIARREVMAALNAGAKELVNKSAQRILDDSRTMVPAEGETPYATGALQASGYVATEGGGTEAYDAAVAAAQFAPETRIFSRNQILPPTVPYPVKNQARAIVDYPVIYATLIENGFFHVHARRHVHGYAFLAKAVDSERKHFFNEAGALLRSLELISPTTLAQKEAVSQEWYQRREQQAARREVRQSNALQFDEFKGRVGQRFMSPERGEQMVEAWSRIRRTAEEIRSGNSNL